VFTVTVTASFAQGKDVYFSYDSGANIIFLLYDNGKKGEATINGKKTAGTVEEKCDTDGLVGISCFHSDKKEFIFMFDGPKNADEYGKSITILNQHYEMPGASEKSIDLYLINQPNNMKLLYHYGDDNYVTGNIPLMNDKAYYLEQLGAYSEAIFILKKVISKSPDRVVAYLNIADAYWGNNEREEAGRSYEKYVELMKSQGKDMKKIPQRVHDRIMVYDRIKSEVIKGLKPYWEKPKSK
jgi:tetratricopeptide (TPR) repeat protein